VKHIYSVNSAASVCIAAEHYCKCTGLVHCTARNTHVNPASWCTTGSICYFNSTFRY